MLDVIRRIPDSCQSKINEIGRVSNCSGTLHKTKSVVLMLHYSCFTETTGSKDLSLIEWRTRTIKWLEIRNSSLEAIETLGIHYLVSTS